MNEREFFATHWNQRWLCRPGEDAKRFSSVFSEQDLLQALFDAHLGERRLRLVRDGESQAEARDDFVRAQCSWGTPPSLGSLSDACSDGATLVFDGMHRDVPTLRAWTQRLAEEVRAPIVGNAYFTPAGATPGFGAHYDTQEVFVLHVLGRKRWTLWETLEPFPIAQEKPPKIRRGGPATDVVLSPGDALYLPRGTWHLPQVVEGPSLHLTVTMLPPRRLDLLQWVTDELAEDPEMRRDLFSPLRPSRGVESSLQGVRAAAMEILARGKLSAAMRKRQFALWTHQRLDGN